MLDVSSLDKGIVLFFAILSKHASAANTEFSEPSSPIGLGILGAPFVVCLVHGTAVLFHKADLTVSLWNE
jgi:hypothetical protein